MAYGIFKTKINMALKYKILLSRKSIVTLEIAKRCRVEELKPPSLAQELYLA